MTNQRSYRDDTASTPISFWKGLARIGADVRPGILVVSAARMRALYTRGFGKRYLYDEVPKIWYNVWFPRAPLTPTDSEE